MPFKLENGNVRITIGSETGWVDAAAVVSDADAAQVEALVTVGSAPSIQDVTSVPEFAAHCEAVQSAITGLTDAVPGRAMLKGRLEKHLDRLSGLLLKVSAVRKVAEQAALHFATEDSAGRWPTMLRLWAGRTGKEREAAFKCIPPELAEALTDLIEVYADGAADFDSAEAEHSELSITLRVALDTATLRPGTFLTDEMQAKAAYAKLHLHGPNLFSTQNGFMVELPEPRVAKGLTVHSNDVVLDKPAEVPDEKLPKVVSLTQEKEKLYLGGGPSGDDVCQGSLGDCYFLSLLASIADHDPDQLKRMIRKSESAFLVTLTRTISFMDRSFRLPQLVEVEPLFAQSTTLGAKNILLGARARAICGNSVVRRRRTLGGDVYLEEAFPVTTAIWVPIMERAFAAFVAAYGLYFTDAPTEDAPEEDGYRLIREGMQFSEVLFACLYGHRLRYSRGVKVEPLGKAVVERPERLDPVTGELFNMLLMVADQTAGNSPCIAVPTASVSWRKVGAELIVLGERYEGPLAQYFAEIGKKLRPVLDEERDTIATLGKDAVFQDACAQVTKALRPLRPKDLWADRVVRLLASLAEPMAEHGPCPYIFARHEYAISGVRLVLAGDSPTPDYVTNPALGTALTNAASLVKAVAALDLQKSTVTLRNPHHRGSPDLDGNLPFEQNTGLFTLSLREFLNFFHDVQYAVVSRHA
ncbi:C2 family cysteine protease [Streptosporangium sp. NPDC006013]|uniref:C2 family cysteine protease n=1 Tax=Streptosporangium sp. NPDC006013 TaxID=3155596 RepID=UPI0033A341E4